MTCAPTVTAPTRLAVTLTAAALCPDAVVVDPTVPVPTNGLVYWLDAAGSYLVDSVPDPDVLFFTTPEV